MTTQDLEVPPSDHADPDTQRESEDARLVALVALLREAGGRIELEGEAWFVGPDDRIWREIR